MIKGLMGTKLNQQWNKNTAPMQGIAPFDECRPVKDCINSAKRKAASLIEMKGSRCCLH